MKNKKFPTYLGLLTLAVGVVAGVFLIQNNQIFRLGAEPSSAPKDVRITNIGDVSFSVTWITEEETSGFVNWGEDRSLGNVANDQVAEIGYTHSVTINGLSPETTYYFEIGSGGENFDNNGIPWQTKTAPSFGDTPPAKLISGSVVTATGGPAKGVLVFAQLPGAGTLSTISSETGNWVIILSKALTQDIKSRALFDESSTVVEISVQGGPQGVATAKIYPKDSNPAPPIILGQIHDFRNLTSQGSEEIPESSIIVPDQPLPTPTSGFEIDEEQTEETPTTEAVTIESLDEGEVVTSIDPEFFGEGPPGTTITITVESEPLTEEVAISPFGSWSWNPSQSLTEGVHKITVTWRDKNGVLQSITRNFVVQAADGPSFESTPSGSTATPTPTPTNTPTPTPTSSSVQTSTPTPTPTATATPTPTPTSQLTPTPTPDLPDAGSLTPTLAGTIMGLGLLIFSAISASFVFLKEKNQL